MTLEEALKYYREGKKIKRAAWKTGTYICNDDVLRIDIENYELLLDDWEVVDESKPKKKMNLYAFVGTGISTYPYGYTLYYRNNLNDHDGVRVPALDQEIEVDE